MKSFLFFLLVGLSVDLYTHVAQAEIVDDTAQCFPNCTVKAHEKEKEKENEKEKDQRLEDELAYLKAEDSLTPNSGSSSKDKK